MKQYRIPGQEVNCMETKRQGEKPEPAIIPDQNYGGKFILLFRLIQSCFLFEGKKKKKEIWKKYI